jgi:hypothetical protein
VSPNLRAAASLLAAAALSLCLGACEGSGCGEPPKEQAKPASGASGGKTSGGGDVGIGQNTQNAINAPLTESAAATTAQNPGGASPGAVFADVDLATYEPKVTKAPGAALVVSYTPSCRNWRDLQAALELFSQDMAGRVPVYRLNVTDPERAALLPSGMTRLPVPGFAYYEGGQALGQRQGLPFDRRTSKSGKPSEDPAEYQQRLRLWLRGAVASKNFDLPEPK